mgnify:CR=1 FL=1
MPTKSIYAPKTEDNDYEQLNTASVLVDFDRDIIEVGSLQRIINMNARLINCKLVSSSQRVLKSFLRINSKELSAQTNVI